MGENSKTASILSYGLIAMTITHALTHVFGGIHTSIFSILRQEFTLSLQQLGIIAAIPPLCQALLTIPTGVLSDRIGAKKMVMASFIVAFIGALTASLAPNPMTFILAVSLVYINVTIYHPASYSYTTKLVSGRDRSKAMGIHGAGGTLGHASGPLAVSLLIGLLGLAWRQVYLILAAPMLLGILVTFLIKETRAESTLTASRDFSLEGYKSLFTANLVMFLVFSSMRMVGTSMIGNFLVLFLQDVKGMNIAFASFLASTTTLTGLIAAPIGGVMASNIGDKKWLLTVFGIAYLLLGLSLLSPNTTLFSILYIGYGFCNTLGMAARSSMMAKLSPSHQRGMGYALFFLPSSIMGAIAPIVAGFLAENYGYNAIFFISLIIFVLSLIILKFKVNIE